MGKKRGGQTGHSGGTLSRVETLDATVEQYAEVCVACGDALNAAMVTSPITRHVFDLPGPKPLIVTEHRAYGCRYTACGAQTRAVFPEKVHHTSAKRGSLLANVTGIVVHDH